MHIRKEIRNATTAALKAAMTETVVSSRTYPLAPEELPAVLVFTNSEDLTVKTQARPRVLERSCELVVECYASDTVSIEDEFDRMCALVEETVFADSVLKALTKGLSLTQITSDVSEKGDQTIGVIRLTFSAVYYTREGTPGVAA